MQYYYTCNNCIRRRCSDQVKNLSVAEYKRLSSEAAFQVVHGPDDHPEVKCPVCGSADTQKVLSIETSYVRGYGYLDKKGVKNDMNLHTMLTGNDPYKEHRKAGDQSELINKLRKQKRHTRKGRDVFMR